MCWRIKVTDKIYDINLSTGIELHKIVQMLLIVSQRRILNPSNLVPKHWLYNQRELFIYPLMKSLSFFVLFCTRANILKPSKQGSICSKSQGLCLTPVCPLLATGCPYQIGHRTFLTWRLS